MVWGDVILFATTDPQGPFLCASRAIAKTDPHPCVFHSHPCERVTFSCLSKRRTPRQRRPRGMLPRGCVNGGRGSPTARPALTANARASLHAPLTGLLVRRSPSLTGTPERAARSCARKRIAGCAPRAACAAGKAAPLALQVPSWPRRVRGEKARRVGARDRAEFAVSAGRAVGKPRSALAQSRAPDARVTAASRVPFSLVTFSWASKRKSPARRDASGKRTDAGRFSRKKHLLRKTRARADRES